MTASHGTASHGPASHGQALQGPAPSVPPSSIFRPSPGPGTHALGWIPIAIAVVMEGAWITVVAGLVQEFSLRLPVLGLATMIAFVVFGVVAARLGRRWARGEWPLIGTAIVFAAAIVGVALSSASRGAFLAGDLTGWLASNPGGLLAGLAVMRGFAYGSEHVAADTVRRALFLGIPLLAVVATLGGMVAEPFRSGFLGDAAFASISFVAAGLLALALSALADARPAGESPIRAHPAWIGAVLLATGGIVMVAVSTGLAGGPSIVVTLQALVAGAIAPLAILGLVMGGRAAIRRLLVIMGATAFIIWFLSFATSGTAPETPSAGGAAGGAAAGTALDPVGVIGVGGIGLVLLALVVFLLVRAWASRDHEEEEAYLDERSRLREERDDRPGAVPRHRRRPWSRAPRTADEAYLALVEELHDVPDVRRRPSETPAEHARRVRVEQLASAPGVGLDFLAADYALSAFGGRDLSAAETGRAIARWRRLRRELRVRPADAPARRTDADETQAPNPMRRSRPY